MHVFLLTLKIDIRSYGFTWIQTLTFTNSGNSSGHYRIIRFYAGSIRHSLTEQLMLLSVDIYKIFFLKTAFYEIRLPRFTVIVRANIYGSFFLNVLFNVVWKVKDLIILPILVVVAVGSFQMGRI